MLVDDIKTLFEEIIDDTVSDVAFYILANNAEEDLEDERDWYIFKESADITRAAGDSHLTAHTLGTSFSRVSLNQDAVRSGNNIYDPIDFDDREEFKDTEGYYYLKYDVTNETWSIYFTGGGKVETVTVKYQKRSTLFAAGVTIPWPRRRGAYLAFRIAERVAAGMDGDELNFKMSQSQRNTAGEMKSRLEAWDADIRLRAQGGRAGMRSRRPLSPRDGIIDINQ